MSSLGELFFSLGLDSQKFDDAIKKAKEKVAELTGETSITINVDANNVAAQVQEDLNKITGKKTEIKLGVDKSSKASVEELINDIAEAEKRLEHLKTKESWNTSAIERQEGFMSSLKKQLEEAKAVKVAASEAKEAIKEAANSTQTIQHVVREEDINLVRELRNEVAGLNEQFELRNRLEQGKRDAAEKNKAERLAKAEELRQKREALKAEKEAIKEEKRLAKEAAKEKKEEERAEKERLKNLEKQIKYAQKQEATREKAFSQVENARMRSMGAEISTLSVYESPEYKREQLLLKRQFEEQDRIAKELEALEKEEAKLKEKTKRLSEAREKRNEYISGRMTEQMLDSIDSIGRQTPEIKALNDYYRELEKSSASVAAKQSKSELQSQLVQLNRLEQAIRKLQYMKVDLDTSDVDKDSEDYKKAAAALDAYIDKLQEMQGSGKRLSKNKVDDVLGADISELMKKVNRVRSGGKWVKEELDEAKDSVSAFGEALGQAFNYYMIERFVRNLYTIGGEFQKQQIALQAMIGDVNKANSIFERTKDMAVMSPFTFSELASYTKQMAAYGIEYEELYDTTKRLADISAGVGVDMGRLILAFGQVRSAAVLRGQELRQFTEAGIPMVNELAKAFSRLENREVKAAEVFDKISRREVSFGMVKDILFGMTDPGGRFFKMQEELAQSLAGQWSNLKDAWEIMIAEIADSANGPLNVLASVMRNIISGWRIWLPLISGAAVGITALNAGLRVTSMLLSAGMMSAATVANIANPLIGALTAVLGIAAGIGAYKSTMESAEDAQKRLNAEMETSLTKLSENERTANRYLDILSKTASKESDKEELLRRQKATLEVLRSMYGDIVQDVKLEELTTERILEWRQKIGNLTSKESGDLLQKNVEENLRALNNAQAELERLSKGTITENIDTGDGKILTVTRKVTQNEIDEATSNVLKFESLYNRAIERQQEYFNRQEEIAQEDLSGWRQKAEELIKGTTLQAPKEDQGMQEYFKYLKEEYDAGKAEFELYAENNPITAANKASAKALRDAANRVNIGLGGVSFLEPKKGDGQADKDVKEAERRGKEMAKAFAEGMKSELDRISSQWDLYKQLFETTGNKEFAITVFKAIPVWDEAAMQMRERLENAMSEKGFEDALEFNISDSLAKVLYGDFYDSWKEIKDRIEKNGIDLKVNTANAIREAKDFEAQIEQIERELHEKLELIGKSGLSSEAIGRLTQSLITNAERAIATVEFDKFKKEIGYTQFFANLEHQGSSAIIAMRDAMLKFGDSANLTHEEMAQIADDIERMMDVLVKTHPFKAIDEAVAMNGKFREEYKLASENFKKDPSLSNANILASAKANLDMAGQMMIDAMSEIQSKFEELSNVVSGLSSMFEKFGNTGLKHFAEALESASNGMSTGTGAGKFIGGLFGQGGAGGIVGGFIGAAAGAMAGLVDAGRKAVEAEQERSQIVVDRLEKAASLLKDRIAESLTGLYNSTLDATSRMEMERKKAEYEEAGKKVQDKHGSIDPNAWYGMTFDKTTFPWDTNDYLVYSKKTHDAINEALRMDNEFMATYASMLAQRDELMYQKATYTDKDSDKVDAYKRDKQLEIEELNAEIEKLAKDMLSSLYNVDFKDWASQLADSIVNAWANGEDAAKAYEATVSDILRNVATSMIQQKILGDYFADNIDPWVKDFIASGGVMTDELYYRLAGIVDGGMERIDQAEEALDAWEKVLNERGMSLKDNKSESSSLSKGIQSVTEDTANLLGSYLNSIRADVSVQRTLIEQLVSVDVPQMSIIAQAQLQQLQQVVANTKRNADAADSIREALSSVIGIGKNGKAIKIV